jgi:hypothetical protein
MAMIICSMVGITLFSMGGVDYIVGQDIDAIGMVCCGCPSPGQGLENCARTPLR